MDLSLHTFFILIADLHMKIFHRNFFEREVMEKRKGQPCHLHASTIMTQKPLKQREKNNDV